MFNLTWLYLTARPIGAEATDPGAKWTMETVMCKGTKVPDQRQVCRESWSSLACSWQDTPTGLAKMGRELEVRAGAQFRAPWQGWFQTKLWNRQDLSQDGTSIQKPLWQLTSPRPYSGILWRGKEGWGILRAWYKVGHDTRVSRSLHFKMKEGSQVEESAPRSGVNFQICIWKSPAQC